MSRAMMAMEGQRRRPSLKESIEFILKEGTGTGPRQGEGEGQKKMPPAPPVPAPVPSSIQQASRATAGATDDYGVQRN